LRCEEEHHPWCWCHRRHPHQLVSEKTTTATTTETTNQPQQPQTVRQTPAAAISYLSRELFPAVRACRRQVDHDDHDVLLCFSVFQQKSSAVVFFVCNKAQPATAAAAESLNPLVRGRRGAAI